MDEIEEQYELAQLLFATALEDKMRYLADLDKGEYIGYKPFGLREVKPGVPENTGVYNIPRFGRNVPTREQPDIITRNIAKIEKFSRHVHENIVMKLFLLFAMVLELPEDYFTKMHSYDDEHSSYLRYMKYHARTPGAKRGTRQYLAQGPQRFWLPDAAVSATYRGVAGTHPQGRVEICPAAFRVCYCQCSGYYAVPVQRVLQEQHPPRGRAASSPGPPGPTGRALLCPCRRRGSSEGCRQPCAAARGFTC